MQRSQGHPHFLRGPACYPLHGKSARKEGGKGDGEEGRKEGRRPANKRQNKMICSLPAESSETLFPKLKNFPETKYNTLYNVKCAKGLEENQPLMAKGFSPPPRYEGKLRLYKEPLDQ